MTELLRLRDFGFRYFGSDKPIFSHLDLSLGPGQCTQLCGPSGSGKSTLLACFQGGLGSAGESQGECRLSVPSGLVLQDPSAQLVCDTVRRELEFGLDNLDLSEAQRKRRMAALCAYFAITPWLGASTAELSFGQKQTLNLAAALALRPQVLLLDEPCAMLDPVAARRLVDLLGHLQREQGLALVIASHTDGLYAPLSPRRLALGAASGSSLPCLSLAPPSPEPCPEPRLAPAPACPAPELLSASHLSLRYGKSAPWVLDDLSLSLKAGSLTAVLGANASGKTTLLYALAGQNKTQTGRIKLARRAGRKVRLSLLPQQVQSLFSQDSVAKELACVGIRPDQFGAGAAEQLSDLLERHPLDLSCGQRQQLALQMMLAQEPDILLFDEPTIGLDQGQRAWLVAAMRQLAEQGRALLFATHDRAFAGLADRQLTLFDGELL
ncbi:MAG: energy-coupling factor ABC transporter ATP-binding protein [Coriobacteriales bacterium]|nr:energy-coupling factor ABC transporter ATP-binding protein [Coriobacteriales bacterium]